MHTPIRMLGMGCLQRRAGPCRKNSFGLYRELGDGGLTILQPFLLDHDGIGLSQP